MPDLPPISLDLECEVERLPNGLFAAAVRHPGVPIVTLDVTYDVGSRVEAPGRTGLAHLFEHLMFEGSENVPKGDHFRLVAEAGGVTNGTTSEDRTSRWTWPCTSRRTGCGASPCPSTPSPPSARR